MSRIGESLGSPEKAQVAFPSSSPASRPDGGFFVEMQDHASDRILITQADVRTEIEWLMNEEPMFEEMVKYFRKKEREIEKMLAENNINKHDLAHQHRVAGMAMAIGRFLGHSTESRRAVGLAASVHDMGYDLPVGRKRRPVQKSDFNNHAALGAELFEELFEHPMFRNGFSQWSDEMKRDALLAIKYHNGASFEEYHAHRSQISAMPKLVRAADHLDNVQDRVRIDRITPSIHKVDRLPDHRLVPASTREMSVLIDRKEKLVEFIHYLDRSILEKYYGKYHSVENLRAGFRNAYGHKIAGVKGIFEDVLHYPATDLEYLQCNVVFVQENGRQVRDIVRAS